MAQKRGREVLERPPFPFFFFAPQIQTDPIQPRSGFSIKVSHKKRATDGEENAASAAGAYVGRL